MEIGDGKGISSLTPSKLLGPLNEVEAFNAPAKLYVSGEFELPLPRPRVSIVGTRTATQEGLRVAGEIASFLVKRGVTVVSGLARGIDTAAHRAAIAGGGRTIAVLGTPLDKFYPPENRELQELIMTKHCAVSQFRPGTNIHKGNFVVRNRVIALISDASVIVEAGPTSGSLRQGWEALRLGRPLFIWHSVFKPTLTWPNKMLDYGATKLERAEEILPQLPPKEGIAAV